MKMAKSKKKSSSGKQSMNKSLVPSTPSCGEKRRGGNHETPDQGFKQRRKICSTGHFNSHFEKFKLLGQGKSGQAFKCKHSLTQQVHAVKIVSVDFGKNKDFKDTYAAREVEILSEHKTSHHVVEYAYSWIEEDQANEGKYKLHILMELCQGSLRDYMANHGEKLSLQQKLSIVVNVAEAVDYLHGSEIIHRDLNMENCFYIEAKDSETPIQVKLGDFGLARKLSPGIVELLTPTKVRGVETGNYNKEVDVSLSAKLTWHTPYQ